MTDEKPLVWRVPPWQAATALLIAAVAAAIAIYLPVGIQVRIPLIVIAVLAALGGIVGARAYLVVDPDGIGWRRLRGETSVPWSDVESLTVQRMRKGRPALMVTRRSAASLEIPPTLVLPTRPTSTSAVLNRLNVTARQITEYGRRNRV